MDRGGVGWYQSACLSQTVARVRVTPMLKWVKNAQPQYRSPRGERGESALKAQDKAHKRWIHPSFETKGRRHQANGLKFSKSQWMLCYLIDTLKIQMLLFWNQWKTPLKDTCYYFCLVVSVGVLFPYTQVQQDSLSLSGNHYPLHRGH